VLIDITDFQTSLHKKITWVNIPVKLDNEIVIAPAPHDANVGLIFQHISEDKVE
jgi:hypothetical protein